MSNELVGTSLVSAEISDYDNVRRDMAREQEWLANERRYISSQDIEEALSHGELVNVGPSESYRPIRTLLEPRNISKHQPYLRPGAAMVLKAVCDQAQDLLRDFGVHGEIRFPITSMVRSEQRQAQIATEPGKLALGPNESGHPTGWDFDIDSSSYYFWEAGEWISVSQRNRQKQLEVAHIRQKQLGEIAMPTVFADPRRYDRRVRLALHYAVAEFFASEDLAPVVEFPNTTHELIHVGVNPRKHEL